MNPIAETGIETLRQICQEAGTAILEVYETDFDVQSKRDASPVTEADMRAHRIIVSRLQEQFRGIPVLSEEAAEQLPYAVRRHWDTFWLVDPLDGTKEFVKRNGQFTVNIALVEAGRPVAGFVYAPVKDLLYFTAGTKAFRAADGEVRELPCEDPAPAGVLRVVGSLSHHSLEMDEFLAEQRQRYQEVRFVPMGSSLKLCLVAEGSADIYPRLAPTMEWDTAAAHAVANAAGRLVVRHDTGEDLTYNKENLRNPWFIVR